MLDILGKRYLFFLISLVIIVPGLVILSPRLHFPLILPGQSSWGQFASGHTPDTEIVYKIYEEIGVGDVQVQTSGDDMLIIRSKFMEDQTRAEIVSQMESEFNDQITVNRFDSVGPSIGKEVTRQAAAAVAVSG